MDAMTPASMLAALPPDIKPVTHDVTIVTTRKISQARVLGVPPEEVGVERGARDIKTCNYFFHDIVTKTEGQLIADGFDERQIMALVDYNGNSETETISRDSVGETFGPSNSGVNKSARLVRITEHYVRMDYDGKGKPSLYMVITGGNQGEILRKDGEECVYPIDVIPFATTTPIPIPHRFFGRSVADIVMPAQREKTALKRGALDNLYLHNNPRVEVAESHAGPNTLDDLLVSRPGGIVRTKVPQGLQWQVVPDITGSVYPMIQYIDAELEARTGLSKQTQGIDANALQNQSATAVAQVFSASQMRLKLIARNFAEGVRDIFSLLHHTIRSHGQKQQTVRLRNNWVDVDPRNWKTRNDLTINVGLGNGGKAQQFAQTMALLNVQKELVLGGKPNLVDDTKLFNSTAELTKIMGHKSPDKFFNDPAAKDPQTGELLHPPPPPQPDPKIIELQLKNEIEKTQAQADIATNDRKVANDAAMQERKFAFESNLAERKFELEKELKMIDAQIKLHTSDQEMAHKKDEHALKVEQAQFGMAANAQSHEAKMEEMKAKPKGKAKASIEVKHGAEELTGPLGEVVKQLGDTVIKSQAQQSEMLLAAMKEMSRPKRIVRDPKTGKASHTEAI
jgi:hypothetical protein